MNSKRIAWIDYSKFIGIFLIVVGHIPNNTDFLNSFLWTFHVPLFFFISGFLYKENTPAKKFLSKKISRIFLPYVYIYLLTVIFVVISKSDYNFQSIYKMSLGFLYGTHSYPYFVNIPLWFLASLFTVELIFNYIIVKHPIIFTLFLITSVEFYSKGFVNLFFSFDLTLLGLNYFIIGYLFNKYRLLDIFKKSFLNLIGLTGLFLIITIVYAINRNVWYGGHYYLISLLGGIIGICMIIYLSFLIDKTIGQLNIISFYSKNTILILGFHTIIINYIYFDLIPIFSFKSQTINAFVTSLIIILILSPLIFLISKYLPSLAGNNRLK